MSAAHIISHLCAWASIHDQKSFVINIRPTFWHGLSGIHKELKTGQRLKKIITLRPADMSRNYLKQCMFHKIMFKMPHL